MDKANSKKKPSVRSLAKATGLSTATISRVINNSESVHADTRARVLEALREHGYVVNSAARALATSRTKTIGAVVPTLSHSIFARYLHAIEQHLATRGYALVIATSNGDIAVEDKRARDLLGLGTEGLILSGAQHAPELITMVKERGIPVICTSVCESHIEGVAAIGYDNVDLAMQAMAYLYQKGHRAFHIVHGPVGGNDRTDLRLLGINNAAQRYKINLSFSEVSLDVAGGRQSAIDFIEQKNIATACLCLSDILALGMIFEFSRNNISIPDQVSIMGFDDLDWASHSDPALTTIGLPVISLGQLTAQVMLDYLDEDKPIESAKIDANIIERETVKSIL